MDAQSFLPHLCICCPSSWLWTEEAQCYQLPRSCCSAGSQIPLITCYSSWTPSEFWVFRELLKDELFGCWLLGCAGLEPACTRSQEPTGHVLLCVQWHQVSSLKSAKVWVFIPQKLANATNQGFFFPPYGKSVVKHLLSYHWVHEVLSAWLCQNRCHCSERLTEIIIRYSVDSKVLCEMAEFQLMLMSDLGTSVNLLEF